MGKKSKRRQTPGKRFWKGAVTYANQERAVITMVLILALGCFAAVVGAAIADSVVPFSVLTMLFSMCVGMGLMTAYIYWFRICYDGEKSFTIRTLFRKTKTYSFSDIQSVSQKPDGKTTFLILKVKRRTIRVNLSCENGWKFAMLVTYHAPHDSIN